MIHTSVRRWLEANSCIEPSLLEGAGLESLVAERLSALGGDESEYLAELARSPEELDRLIAGIAVPETWLFRYPRSYDLLLECLERRLAGGVPTLRMLSIGCATGQEPYCMAMTALHAGWPRERVSVEALDRNRGFLDTAVVGVYGAASVRTEIPAWAVPFLRRSGDTVEIEAAVRSMVRLTRADITSPGALRGVGPCDVIFCRNVLIYLNAAAREQLVESICAELAVGGLLFVGHAEQIVRAGAPLRAVTAPHAFALERIDAASPAAGRTPSLGAAPAFSPAVRGVTAARPPAATPPPARYGSPTADSLEDARVLADTGRASEAETMIRAIIARDGPSAPTMELLGMIRMSVNDSAGAKRLFEQSVYLEPNRSASLLQLALISERAGDARRAAAYWERARRTSADGQKAGGP